jgi:hypothetical protein
VTNTIVQGFFTLDYWHYLTQKSLKISFYPSYH